MNPEDSFQILLNALLGMKDNRFCRTIFLDFQNLCSSSQIALGFRDPFRGYPSDLPPSPRA